MDLGAALLALLLAGVVKVAVMVLGARMVLKLYQAAYQEPPKRLWLLLPESDLPEVRVLWWSLLLFFFSELACGVEVYILFRSSAVIGALHGLASAAGMGLFALGMWLHLDRHFFRYGERSCLANRLCRGCTFEAPERCKFLPVILLAASFVVIAAAGALFVPAKRLSADMTRYVLPFPALNAWYAGTVQPLLKAHLPNYQPTGEAYFYPRSIAVLEFWLLPALAGLLATAAIILLRRRREAAGVRVAAFSLGVLAYGWLSIVLNVATGDILIGSFGHELAELWFLLICAEYLRRSYGAPGGDLARDREELRPARA